MLADGGDVFVILIHHLENDMSNIYSSSDKAVHVFFYKHMKILGLGSDMYKATQNIG